MIEMTKDSLTGDPRRMRKSHARAVVYRDLFNSIDDVARELYNCEKRGTKRESHFFKEHNNKTIMKISHPRRIKYQDITRG